MNQSGMGLHPVEVLTNQKGSGSGGGTTFVEPGFTVPSAQSREGWAKATSAFLIGAVFPCSAVRFAFFPYRFTARRLLAASIIYLPLMFVVIVAAER